MEGDSLEYEEITLVGGIDDHILEAGPRDGRHDQGHGRQGQGESRRHRDRGGPRDAPRRSRYNK